MYRIQYSPRRYWHFRFQHLPEEERRTTNERNSLLWRFGLLILCWVIRIPSSQGFPDFRSWNTPNSQGTKNSEQTSRTRISTIQCAHPTSHKKDNVAEQSHSSNSITSLSTTINATTCATESSINSTSYEAITSNWTWHKPPKHGRAEKSSLMIRPIGQTAWAKYHYAMPTLPTWTMFSFQPACQDGSRKARFPSNTLRHPPSAHDDQLGLSIPNYEKDLRLTVSETRRLESAERKLYVPIDVIPANRAFRINRFPFFLAWNLS